MAFSANQFGFTNDDDHIEAVRKWVADAVADGWTIRPTYESEPVESAAKMHKDGFTAMALMRVHEAGKKWKYEAQLSVWGPDGLAIRPSPYYDFTALKAGLRNCPVCRATDVETERYAFAGRCCAVCLPKMREMHEEPGWNN